MPADPLAYLITFSCYGSWLHGDDRGSVDRQHNEYERGLLPPDAERQQRVRAAMTEPPYHLDEQRREVVLRAIRQGCEFHTWVLHPVHVRSNHVHLVISAPVAPEQVLGAVKAYGSHALTQTGRDTPNRKRWTRHGSTRYLWLDEHVAAAVRYVAFEQGQSMAVYLSERYADLEQSREGAEPVVSQPRPSGRGGVPEPRPEGRGSDGPFEP